MLTTRWRRATALFILLGAVFAGCVWFGALQPAPTDGRYPSTDDIVQHPDQYEGEPVVVNGEVVASQPLRVEASYSFVRDGRLQRGTVPFTITNAKVAASIGDEIQVFGVLHQEQTIQATRIVVTPSRNVRYMYAISALAGLWVLSRLLRQWRFAADRFAVVPRSGPIRLTDIIRQLGARNTDEDTDA